MIGLPPSNADSKSDGGEDAGDSRGFGFGAFEDYALSFGVDFKRREFRLKL